MEKNNFHVLLVVNSSYFSDENHCIKRDRWLESWQQAINNHTLFNR
ncbi:protein rep [Gracilibacillus orientalis]